MSRKIGILFAALVMVAGLGSTDAEASAYVGAAAGPGSTEGSGIDASATGYKILGGYRFMKFFGVEGDYRTFGKADDEIFGETIEIDTTTLDVFAVGVLPLGASNFELFGKAGFSSWNMEMRVVGLPDSFDDDGNDLAYGLGAAYNFSKFALRLEYEEFDVDGPDSVNMATFGFDYRF